MTCSDYAYISSKIKALEILLPDKVDLERMLDAPSFEESFKVLNDTDYADNMLNIIPTQFNQALREDQKQLKELLSKNIPSPEFLKILFLEDDWNNIKSLIKAKLFSKEISEEQLSPIGNLKIPALKKFILEEREDITIPQSTQELIQNIYKKQAKTPHPQNIDMAADRCYLKEIITTANKSKLKNIKKFCQIVVDQANIKSIIRNILLKTPKREAVKYLTFGGTIEISDLLAAYDENSGNPILSLVKTKLHPKSIPFWDKFAQKNELIFVEKALEKHLAEFMNTLRYIAIGPEVILSYFQKKKNALNNVRVILIGKQNELPRNDITLRLISL